jgi:hypothetical protein
MEDNLPEGLTVFAFPEPHRRLIRTTNGLERVNRELKRRTMAVGIYPNPAACLRLVTKSSLPLSAGSYHLTVPGDAAGSVPAVRAVDGGVILDGDYNGEPGGNFVLAFEVKTGKG